MRIIDRLLDLSARKIIRKLLAALGKGDPWLKAAPDVRELLGDEQFEKISRMPRYTEGKVYFDGLSVDFNDNGALFGMLDEIFIRQNYLFTADNNQPRIIDCGANIGIGVLYLKKLYPKAEIHAFEPDAKAFSCLEKNIKSNALEGIHIYQKAVWIKNEDLEFFSDNSWGGGIHAKSGATPITVEAIDLSDFINQKVDLLKMDIEGAEVTVLEHVTDKIATNVQKLFCEWHSFTEKGQELGKLLSSLEKSGFRYHIKEASQRVTPFQYIPPGAMDSQLEVYAYRT